MTFDLSPWEIGYYDAWDGKLANSRKVKAGAASHQYYRGYNKGLLERRKMEGKLVQSWLFSV